MNIVFMGSPDFAIPSLNRLQESSHTIQAVVSGKDKRRGRGGGTSPTPVKKQAQKLGLSTISVENLRGDGFASQLRALKPDLLVVVAFRILPPSVLAIPSRGSINLHASLLPKYRGAAPIHWAVMNGEAKTGCTTFWLNETVDTGAIIQQQQTPIGENETTGEVYNRLRDMGSDLMIQSVNAIAGNEVDASPQNDDKATPAPKLFKDDCKVDFSQPAAQVHNFIRGLSPFPTAWATLDGQKFNFYRSRLSDFSTLSVGEIAMHENKLLAGCGSASVVLEEVQLQGKRRMSGKDFYNGYDGSGMIR